MLNAESVMRAWCQWILRFSSVCSDLQLPYDDDGAIRCTAINAANVVDAILNRVLGVIEEWRICCAVDEDDLNEEVEEEGGSSSILSQEQQECGEVEWEAKLVDLVNCAIDAWANTKNRDGEAVQRAEGWLTYLQQTLSQQKDEEKELLVSSEEEGHLLHSHLSDDVLKLFEESYRGVIKACIRSHERRYLGKSMKLLDEMRLQQQPSSSLDATGDLDTTTGAATTRLFPATPTCNLVLYGLANCEPCEENAQKAEQLLEEISSPDANTFRQVIIAWTKSSSKMAAAKNARRVLDRMLEEYPMLDPDPSTLLMTLYLKLGKVFSTTSSSECALSTSFDPSSKIIVTLINTNRNDKLEHAFRYIMYLLCVVI